LRRDFPGALFLRWLTMPARIDIPPELLAEGKFLYEETLAPVSEIWERMGISRCTFYARVREGKWVRRRYTSIAEYTIAQAAASHDAAPAAPAGDGPDITESDAVNKPAPAQRAALSVRVYEAVQRQMDAIESIQRTLRPGKEMQSERTVRILATLNKALREIAAITKTDETTPSDAADKDPLPHNIDEFRRELARRIKGLVEAERKRAGEGAGEPSSTLAG
jgi:hypothetical protein